MNTETELKLEILPEDLPQLLSDTLFSEPDGVIRQRSVYFDTDDQRLFQSGFTVRIRQAGDALTQTVKAQGPDSTLFARKEWEFSVADMQPVINHASPLANELEGNSAAMEPQFAVEVERQRWHVDQDGSRIEVVLDRGLVIAGNRQSPLCEMELELKDGDPKVLFALARRIAALAPFQFGVLSKAERGYRLMRAQQGFFKAEAISLHRSMRATSTLQAVAFTCLRHFRLNETAFRERRSAEALHQARVALRRLRSALTVYKPLLQDDESQRLKDELKWLASVFGHARDVDTLLARAPLDTLRDCLHEARALRYADVLAALDSNRGRTLMLDVTQWIQCGAYLTPGDDPEAPDAQATVFAGDILERLRKKLKRHGRALADVDDEARHEARKDAKKLRYAAEFFGSLFAGRRGKRRYRNFMAAMQELQDRLGALNDLVAVPAVLESLGLGEHPEAGTLVAQGDKTALIHSAQHALDNVIDAKRFWR